MDSKPEVKEKLRAFMSDWESLDHLSSIFKVLSEPTRLKIIYALSFGEMNVSELVENTEMTQSSISHQLQILRRQSLVKQRKEGRKVFYSLDDDHVLDMFLSAYDHSRH